VLTAWTLIFVVATLSCSAQAAETGALLSTAPLAKQVSALGTLLSESPTGTTVEDRRKAGFVLRGKISQFVVDQIEAKPNITKDQLRAQLRAIICAHPNLECDCNHPPYVLANAWFGPRGTSQFVVAYQINLGFMGPKGSITVLESYVVEDGKAKRSAAGGGEFDAYNTNFEMVQQFFNPVEIWVLTWGMVNGASGRGLRGRAAVYRISTDSVTIAWDDDRQDNLTAQTNAIGWEVNYAAHDLLYGNDPKPYFFDAYEVDPTKRTFSRTVHYQHGAE
jgi:hypothetical protein